MPSGDTIFISSTSEDLAEFRKPAIHVARRLGMRVEAMEDFGPNPRNAVALCEEKVRSSDIFLGLYAYRYGHEPAGFDGVSITEMEYAWAVDAGLTVLVFMADEDHPWPPRHVDTGESRAKLDRFKAGIKTEHVIAGLTTAEKLREDLFVHLPKFRTELPERTSAVVSVIPAPPRPYVAHTYTLLQTEQVIGRAKEFALLDRWVSDPADRLHAARVLCVVAIGGMGKSALTWKWMHDHAPATMTPLAGRMWWSFYETDAGFDQFVIAALGYCTGRSLAAVGQIPRADREAELLAVLNEKPFLLVLDGMERLLIAYAGMDFAHLADDDLDRRSANVVAGALGLPGVDAQAMVSQHRLRKTIDPHVGGFLRKLSRIQASRVLVTTRLYPSELQTDTGRELPRCAAVFLRGLEPADALALWRGLGVSGSDEELDELFARFDHYPLLIRALAGEVARFRRAPGNFGAWRRANPGFDPFSLPLVQVKSHVLGQSLTNLDQGSAKLLHSIAAFRSPVDYETLLALFTHDGTGWSADRLDAALTELEDRGLVGWDKINNRYDLHPIVRGVVWSAIDDAARSGVYNSLLEHFEAISRPIKKAKSLSASWPAIELFNALVGLGRIKEAADIYFERIFSSHPYFELEGAVHLKIAMLESLLPDNNQSKSLLSQLGHAYTSVGRLRDALECFLQAIECERSRTTRDIHLLFSNLAETQFLLGQLRVAFDSAKLAAGNRRYEAVLALCEAVTGRITQARYRLGKASRWDLRGKSGLLAQFAIWDQEYAEATRQVLFDPPYVTGIVVVPAVFAEALMNLGNTAEAADLLNNLLKETITLSLRQPELETRKVLAELYRRQGKLREAREVLDDVWDMAERGGYRLVLADCYLVLAKIESNAGNFDAARVAAAEAYRQAYCDGPPYTYHWALEKAKALIEELGTSIPEM